jgi:2-polyprenyl-3-methyl-5-hydroxy-6-metoxy-1,4-benzoquinol methylase
MLTSEIMERSIAYAESNFMDDHAPHLQVDKAFIREHFNLHGKRVLDFGCGMGGMSLWYANNWDCSVHAVDIDGHHIHIAEQLKSKHKADRVTFEKRDILHTPLTETYDAIFMNDVAEHIPYPVLEQIFRQLALVMAPGARLFVSYPPWEGPYASHVQHITGVLWSQYIPKPLLMRWIKKKNIAITGELESDLVEAYEGLNRLNHKRLTAVTDKAGLQPVVRLSHSFLRKIPGMKGMEPRSFPLNHLVSKELLIFERR